MKLGIFADPHFSSQKVTSKPPRYNSLSLEKIEKIYGEFKKNGCDLVVCLGDLIDGESTIEKVLDNLKKIGDVIKASGIPTVCIMGNHDAFTLTKEQFYRTLEMEAPRDITVGDNTLIFLDACHYTNGKHYTPGDGSDYQNTFLPNEDELRDKLSRVNGNAYLFIHQNIDPNVWPDHRIKNSEGVFNIIKESGVVRAVFQGHFHFGQNSVHDGIQYITLPAVCEQELPYLRREI